MASAARTRSRSQSRSRSGDRSAAGVPSLFTHATHDCTEFSREGMRRASPGCGFPHSEVAFRPWRIVRRAAARDDRAGRRAGRGRLGDQHRRARRHAARSPPSSCCSLSYAAGAAPCPSGWAPCSRCAAPAGAGRRAPRCRRAPSRVWRPPWSATRACARTATTAVTTDQRPVGMVGGGLPDRRRSRSSPTPPPCGTERSRRPLPVALVRDALRWTGSASNRRRSCCAQPAPALHLPQRSVAVSNYARVARPRPAPPPSASPGSR